MKNEILFRRIKKLVATERRIGTKILDCLFEIERRKAYAELRYDGLFTYCVRELGFTDSQAYQRIQAMRALKEMPELKGKIESGALSVSAISKVQTHFRRERKEGVAHAKSEKLELFEAMENCTSREIDLKLAEVRGEAIREKLVLELDEELSGLWKEVKDLAAHRSGGIDTEAFKILAREWLERNDPARKSGALREKKSAQEERRDPSGSTEVECESAKTGDVTAEGPGLRRKKNDPTSRIVPAGLKREIWTRDGGKCTGCGSRHAVQVDHIHAFALGGSTEKENLRLLCRSCNQFAAIRSFGVAKMSAKREKRF